MKKFWSNLSLNKKLALIAIMLGLVALFAGDPYGGTTIKVNEKELKKLFRHITRLAGIAALKIVVFNIVSFLYKYKGAAYIFYLVAGTQENGISGIVSFIIVNFGR